VRRLAALALFAACSGGKQAPASDAGNVSLVLDIPNGALDPQGYTSVELVLHEPTGDVPRTATVDLNGNFDLDRIDPSNSVSVESTLRNASGAAVGDGRTAVSSALAGGADHGARAASDRLHRRTGRRTKKRRSAESPGRELGSEVPATARYFAARTTTPAAPGDGTLHVTGSIH
jgi:hypothetical protein